MTLRALNNQSVAYDWKRDLQYRMKIRNLLQNTTKNEFMDEHLINF